jgi:hypothetical protein
MRMMKRRRKKEKEMRGKTMMMMVMMMMTTTVATLMISILELTRTMMTWRTRRAGWTTMMMILSPAHTGAAEEVEEGEEMKEIDEVGEEEEEKEEERQERPVVRTVTVMKERPTLAEDHRGRGERRTLVLARTPIRVLSCLLLLLHPAVLTLLPL